jgi:hypothetical protein
VDAGQARARKAGREGTGESVTIKEFTAFMQAQTVEQREAFARRFNSLSFEEIAESMGSMPTDALEWGVKFELLSRRTKERLTRKSMNIEATLTIEIHEIDADEWTADEYRVQKLCEGLTAFVRQVADDHAKSPAEAELIVMSVAKSLFDSFYADAVSEILRERLMRKDGPR